MANPSEIRQGQIKFRLDTVNTLIQSICEEKEKRIVTTEQVIEQLEAPLTTILVSLDPNQTLQLQTINQQISLHLKNTLNITATSPQTGIADDPREVETRQMNMNHVAIILRITAEIAQFVPQGGQTLMLALIDETQSKK